MNRAAEAYARALVHRRLVRLAQFAVTGERMPRRVPMLAAELHCSDFVLDLGCGSAPVLRFASPARYVGIDEHAPSLDAGRSEHAGAGREFVLAPLRDADLRPWLGADVVVLSSVCHHLDDGAVIALARRVMEEVAPMRVLVQDAEPTGPLGPLVRVLDDGDHLRPRAALENLLRRCGQPRLLWTYDNPLRSFHQFLYELRPLSSTR